MKALCSLLLVSCLFHFHVSSQNSIPKMYAANPTGINIYQKPDTTSKIITKIPYNTVITFIENMSEELPNITLNKMTGSWQKVKYSNKVGYIIDIFLLPLQPPNLLKVKEMSAYLKQLSPIVIKAGPFNYYSTDENELPGKVEKVVFRNGTEWHSLSVTSNISDKYFFPGLTLQQGYILAKLIPEFSYFLESTEYKPLKIHIPNKNDDGVSESYFEEIFFTDAATTFRMLVLGNQLIIYIDLFV